MARRQGQDERLDVADDDLRAQQLERAADHSRDLEERHGKAMVAGRKWKRQRLARVLPHVLLSAPAAVVYALFVLLPVALMLYYSFTDWDGVTIFPEFVGLENYETVMSRSTTLNATWVTVKFTLLTGVITNILGLGIALLVNRPDRLTLWYRLALFVPITLSSVVVGILWHVLFDFFGTVNSVLEGLGHERVSLLGNPNRALWLIVAAAVWQFVGFSMMVYLAGLQSLPMELLEAAEIDGASRWQRFRYVVLPLLAPIVTINVVLMLIAGLKQYDLVRVITNGGPFKSTETIAFRILTDGQYIGDYGPAVALAVLLVLFTGAITFITLRLRRKKELSIQ